jgi:hypothetical protein
VGGWNISPVYSSNLFFSPLYIFLFLSLHSRCFFLIPGKDEYGTISTRVYDTGNVFEMSWVLVGHDRLGRRKKRGVMGRAKLVLGGIKFKLRVPAF